MKAQIADTWEKIQEHDFYTGCGKEDCDWCNFVKEHKLYVSLVEEAHPNPPEGREPYPQPYLVQE